MKLLLWAFVAFGLARSSYRFIKARRIDDGLYVAFWLTLAVASVTGAPVAKLIALGFLVAALVKKHRPSYSTQDFDSSHPGSITLDADSEELPSQDPQSTNNDSPPDPEEFIRSIPEYAENCVDHAKILTSDSLDYTPESLVIVDKIITEGWGGEVPALVEPMLVIFGSYVGETIRRKHGGEWIHSEDFGYALVGIDGRDFKVFPFEKVLKRFTEGDSLAFFYEALKESLEKDCEEDDSD